MISASWWMTDQALAFDVAWMGEIARLRMADAGMMVEEARQAEDRACPADDDDFGRRWLSCFVSV